MLPGRCLVLANCLTYDCVFEKRVLTYWEIWENRRNTDYSYMDDFIVPMENYYIFGKVRSFPFQKYIVCHAYYEDNHSSGCNQDFPFFPQISQYVYPFREYTESYTRILAVSNANCFTVVTKKQLTYAWHLLDRCWKFPSTCHVVPCNSQASAKLHQINRNHWMEILVDRSRFIVQTLIFYVFCV